MSEARAARRKAKTDWLRRVRRLYREGAGVYEMEVVMPEHLPGLLARIAVDQDAGAYGVMKMVAEVIQNFEQNRALECFSCGAVMQPKVHDLAAVATVRAARDDPSMMMGGAICRGCVGPDMMERALAAVRLIDPSARQITIHPSRGTA